MTSKRYNIWLEIGLIDRIRLAAQRMGIKVSTYIRVAILEKLERDK